MISLMPMLRMLGALSIVLGLLAGALWAVRRLGVRLPGAVDANGPGRRVELVERVGLDGKRSIALIRRDGREHLLLLAPEGPLVIEAGIIRDDLDLAAARKIGEELAARRVARTEAMTALHLKAGRVIASIREANRGGGESFAALVDRARTGLPARRAPQPVVTAAALIAAKRRPRKAA